MSQLTRTQNPVVSSFRPTGKKLLVTKIFEPDKIGSIFIPERAFHTEAIECLVKAVGREVDEIKPGDHIWTNRQLSFNRIEINEEICFIVPLDHVLAKNSQINNKPTQTCHSPKT